MSSRTEAKVTLRCVGVESFAEVAKGLDLLICQTPQWLKYLKESQTAEPVLAQVIVGNVHIGIFTGGIVRKAGLKILGSPLRGWTTSYMGFSLTQQPAAQDLLTALRRFALGELGCAHIELLDRSLSPAAFTPPWHTRLLHGYEIGLAQSEKELFAAMSPGCRRAIRKAEKSGVTVETVSDPEGFAAEYYSQLLEVFAKDGIRPHYSQRRVEQLIAALHPHGMLLLLRARDATGRCLATSIFPGHGSLMYFWGGASRQDALLNRPNEAMLWYAMRWWKAHGATRFDMGGGGDYKKKYGGTPIAIPWARCSRSPLIAALRSGAERAQRWKQRLRGSSSR